MECWSFEKVEYWGMGLFHYSTTPLFREFSTTNLKFFMNNSSLYSRYLRIEVEDKTWQH